MSQSELARRLGFRQSTINGLIKGDQRSTTKLPQLARELQTTPEYLTGESDDPAATSHSPPPMSSERRELLDCFDRLDRADQLALLQIARSMGGIPNRRRAFMLIPRASEEKVTADQPRPLLLNQIKVITPPRCKTGGVDAVQASEAAAQEAPKLKYQELELIECFYRLSRAEQIALLQVARSMAKNKPPAPCRPPVKPRGFGESREWGWWG